MSARGAWARAGLVVLVVLVLDQITKALVRAHVELGDSHKVLPGLHLEHVANRGVAFSRLSGHTGWVIAFIVLAVSALLVYFARNPTKPWAWLPTGMLAGGAVGNVVDRLARGEVTDFLKLPHWPAFNVADMGITLGVLLLVLVVEKTGAETSAA